MAEEILVDDLRPADDPSLQVVPRLETFSELQQWFGVVPRYDFGWGVAPVGQPVLKLVKIELRSGLAVYLPKVLKADGTPWNGASVARSWPGAPPVALNTWFTPDYSTVVGHGYKVGVVGQTNTAGECGFPYSKESGLPSQGGKGPDALWPLIPADGTPPQYADALDGCGWYFGTNHLTPSPVFQVATKTEIESTRRAYLLDIDESGQVVGHIPWQPGPPPSGQAALGLIIDDELIGHMAWNNGQPDNG